MTHLLHSDSARPVNAKLGGSIVLSRLKITDSNGKPIGDHMLLVSIVIR